MPPPPQIPPAPRAGFGAFFSGKKPRAALSFAGRRAKFTESDEKRRPALDFCSLFFV